MLWTKWCPGQVEPSARGMNSIAASATGALDLTRVRLLRLLCCWRQWPAEVCRVAAARQLPVSAVCLLELGPGCGRYHLPYQAYKGTGQIQVILYAKRLFQVADLNLSLGQPTGARGFGQ